MIDKRLLAALAAGLTLLGGCSSAAPASAPASTAASAPATAAPGSAESVDALMARMVAAQAGVKTYTMTMDTKTAVGGAEVSMTMNGAVDQSDPANVKMKIDSTIGGMDTKMLQVDGERYMQMALTGGKWVKLPKGQAGQFESTAGSTDFAGTLDSIKSSVKSIESLGEETVEGVKATHHRLTIDTAALSKLGQSEGTLGDDTFVYDVWLDDASLVRKVAMDLTMKADGKSVPLKVTGLMGGYNEPVTIVAPSADEITKMPG